jgi:SAP domain-containing new25/Domain of unknown function (DUF6434)
VADDRRPQLAPGLDLEEFRQHYWYRDELARFCRSRRLPASGSKQELIARVEAFLQGQEQPATPVRRGRAAERTGPITLATPVTGAFKSDAETRAFFKSVIGEHFHFTAHMQAYRRERMRSGEPLTYGDLAREWVAERERRATAGYRSGIAPTWQYNQFVRDFMADGNRKGGASFADAAKAWNKIKAHRGPHTYEEYLRLRHTTGGSDAARGDRCS